MDVAYIFSEAKNFFREDTDEIIGAYFDGEIIFLANASEAVEIAADGDDFAQLAEKISETCRQHEWKNSIGFCLRDNDAVTFQTDVANVPEKDLPKLVESWSRAQAGDNALNSFVKIGDEIWMESLPQSTANEICAAFRKFGLNLLALSAMPTDLLTKKTPLEYARFIAEIASKKISPNLLRGRGSSWNLQKISLTLAAIFLIAAGVHSAVIFSEWLTTSNKLDEAKLLVSELRDDLNLKKFIDDDTTELRRLNNLTASINSTKTFNLLINLGKVFGGDVRLTNISLDENSAQVDGLAKSPEAVKSCLARMRNSVEQSARLENSSVNDDGEIVFAIRADLK